MKTGTSPSGDRRQEGEQEPVREAERKPYTAPRLVKHGTIAAQTATDGSIL